MPFTADVPPANDCCFRFDITADENLDAILNLAFSKNKLARSYKVIDNKLVLSWVSDATDGWTPFLVPLDAQGVLSTVVGWLVDREPVHDLIWQDGTTTKGFRVYNEQWGYVGGAYRAFVAIEPHWIHYGK